MREPRTSSMRIPQPVQMTVKTRKPKLVCLSGVESGFSLGLFIQVYPLAGDTIPISLGTSGHGFLALVNIVTTDSDVN